MEKFPKDEPNLGKKPPQYLTETLNNVKMIAEVLNDIISENLTQSPDIESDKTNQFDYFTCKKPPHISILKYLTRIVKYTRPEPSTIILALILIDSLTERQDLQLTHLNIHRIILLSVVIAIKYNEDEYYSNSFYAKVGGITLKEFNVLEYKFLYSLDFDLFIDDETFLKYKIYLENDGANGNNDNIDDNENNNNNTNDDNELV